MDKRAKQFSHLADDQFHSVASHLAQVIIGDLPESFAHSKTVELSRHEADIYKQLHSFQKRIEEGAYQLFEAILELSYKDPSVFNSRIAEELSLLIALCSNLPENHEQYVGQLSQGFCLQEIARISDETLQLLYLAAKSLYEHKRHKEARDAFAFLTLLNPGKFAFWLGLGDSEYMMHRYEQALVAYSFASHTNASDPVCHLYSCRCYEKIKDFDNALNALDLALCVIGERSDYTGWKSAIATEKMRLETRK